MDCDTLRRALRTLTYQRDRISSGVGEVSSKRALCVLKRAMYVDKEIKCDTLKRTLRTLKHHCDGISSGVGEMSSKRAPCTLKRALRTLMMSWAFIHERRSKKLYIHSTMIWAFKKDVHAPRNKWELTNFSVAEIAS